MILAKDFNASHYVSQSSEYKGRGGGEGGRLNIDHTINSEEIMPSPIYDTLEIL